MTVAVIGIGLHPFGRFQGVSGIEMGAVAAREALRDAGIEWNKVRFAVGGSMTAGEPDALVSHLGLTGIPFINIRNGCATGASALLTASSIIEAGQFDLGLVVGFDKHPPGHFDIDPETIGLDAWYAEIGLMLTPQFFAMKINRYAELHGISPSTLAMVASKNYRNGALNPAAWRRKPFTVDEVLASPMLSYPLTQYMFSSPNEGAAAVLLCPADRAHNYTETPVFIRGMAIRSRRLGAFEVFSPWLPIETAESPTVDASKAAFEMAGIGPEDVDLAQLQDSEAGAEIMHMAENGLCEDGQQEYLVPAGETEIGGRLPVNTDGGLIANGEPVGASGLRQVYETVLQLRGAGGSRQVPGNPKVGFTQVYGGPGTGACTILTT